MNGKRRYNGEERGEKARTLAVGAGEDEVSDCLRLEIVVGLVADAALFINKVSKTGGESWGLGKQMEISAHALALIGKPLPVRNPLL
jgi:hypothetical protein